MSLEIGPKLLESIGHNASRESLGRAQECVVRVGFAVNALRVREKIVPQIRREAGIGLRTSLFDPKALDRAP